MDSTDHTRDGFEQLILQSKFGASILRLSADPSAGFGLMLAKAQQAYLEALDELTVMDFSAPDALLKGQRLQNEMRRYADMVAWITEAVEASTLASEELKQRVADAELASQIEAHNEEMRNFYGSEAE